MKPTQERARMSSSCLFHFENVLRQPGAATVTQLKVKNITSVPEASLQYLKKYLMKPQSWVILQKNWRDIENRFLFSFNIISIAGEPTGK